VNKSNILYIIIGLTAGLWIGFTFANAVYHVEGTPSSAGQLQASRENNQPAGQQSSTAGNSNAGPRLQEEELREAIARTEARPDDIALQRKMGLALYAYANQTQDASLLPDVARMLKRAYDANPNDHELILQMANVLFAIGQTSDPARFSEARTYYLKALEIKPDDANARTDLGLTYYLGQPSDPKRAIAEYRKSLQSNPRDERTLQSLAAALISTGNYDEAQRRIAELEKIDPQNSALPNLRAQLAQSKNAAAQE
jgi:tetratricopeptide (TPR) repeat protein